MALAAELSDEELEWVGDLQGRASVKWHVGHVALRERELLAPLVPPLTAIDLARHPAFGEEARLSVVVDYPEWDEVEELLGTSRRLTESLLAALPLRDGLEDIFLGVLNHEYEHARHVRSLRLELGRPDIPDPAGRLVEIDTDCEEPPRFYLPSFVPPVRGRKRATGPRVVHLDEHRRQRSRDCLEQGHALVARGDHGAALEAFERSHGWRPTADALTYQGWMHSLLGDVERAEEFCLQAIEVDPEFGNPYNDIGTFCLRRRDVESAIRWFEKAKNAPRYEPRHFPYINLGRLYLSLGMPEKALAEFEGALQHDPDNAEVHQAVLQIRREMGRAD